MLMVASGTPLWPAGHLPLKGGDQLPESLAPIANLAEFAVLPELPISLLEGEMAGGPERGVALSREFAP